MRRPVLTVLTTLGVLVLLGLGTWQVARLQWKEGLIARAGELATADPVPLEADDALYRSVLAGGELYRHVSLTGGFPTAEVVHVFGTHDGVPGWFVFQPFRADRLGVDLMVDRGFVPEDDRATTYPLPDAERLRGLVRYYEAPGGLGAAVAPPADLARGTAYDRRKATLTAPFGGADAFAPFYLDSTLPTTLPRGGTTRLDFSNRHLGYAITWYGLAAGLVAVYVAMTRRR